MIFHYIIFYYLIYKINKKYNPCIRTGQSPSFILKIFNKNIHFNIYKFNFVSIWRGTKMLNFKKRIRTKLKIINEYWDQIEYKKLTLTCGMILA